MKKRTIAILVSLLTVLLVSATNVFAQKRQIIKNLNSTKLERLLARSTYRVAPRVPGVYIPAGTPVYALERKIALTAQKAGVKLDEKEIHVIASLPEALQQFQVQTGMAIFQGRPLPKEKSLKALQANQKKFATARANGEYEQAWAQFVDEYGKMPFAQGKSYRSQDDIAKDIYNFYVKHIGTENLPRVRLEDIPDFEAVVCEIPVNGLSLIRPRPFEDEIELSAEEFVVVRSDNGRATLMSRDALNMIYRVIK